MMSFENRQIEKQKSENQKRKSKEVYEVGDVVGAGLRCGVVVQVIDQDVIRVLTLDDDGWTLSDWCSPRVHLVGTDHVLGDRLGALAGVIRLRSSAQ